MTAPVRRPSVPAAVGENRKRIRILEATPNSSCYVFLGEDTVTVADDLTLSITGIDQTYRHLVVEIQVGAVLGLEDLPDNPPDILVDFGYDYMDTPEIVYADPVEPTSPIATKGFSEDSFVTMSNCMSFDGYFSYATMKIPYYAEAVLNTGGLWSSVGHGYFTAPGGVARTGIGAAFSTGGFINQPPTEGGPIVSVEVRCSERTFLVNTGDYNALTVYVAGDRVTYLGESYVSIAGSVGVAPVPFDGGASWLNRKRSLTIGSRMSVYGVC